MDIKNILKELTSAVGVSGKETDAVLTAQRLLSEFGKRARTFFIPQYAKLRETVQGIFCLTLI